MSRMSGTVAGHLKTDNYLPLYYIGTHPPVNASGDALGVYIPRTPAPYGLGHTVHNGGFG